MRTVAGRLGHGGGGTTTLKVYSAWRSEADQRAASSLGMRMPALPVEVEPATPCEPVVGGAVVKQLGKQWPACEDGRLLLLKFACAVQKAQGQARTSIAVPAVLQLGAVGRSQLRLGLGDLDGEGATLAVRGNGRSPLLSPGWVTPCTTESPPLLGFGCHACRRLRTSWIGGG